MTDSSQFKGIQPSSTVDYMVRTIQQNYVQQTIVADSKANIMITLSSLVLSFSITQLGNVQWRIPLIILMAASLGALVTAILAVLPRGVNARGKSYQRKGVVFNPLFFGHLAHLEYEDALEKYAAIMKEPEKIYHAIVTDLYGMSKVLSKSKYKFLRWSYITFLTGMIISGSILLGLVLAN
jgi:hypothetical protein